MSIFPNHLLSPLYLPEKEGYKTPNHQLFSGIDFANLVHDLQLLDAGQGSGENLQQTLSIGSDAGGLNIDNLNILEVKAIVGNVDVVITGDNISITGNAALNLATSGNLGISANGITVTGTGNIELSNIVGTIRLNDKVRSSLITYANNAAATGAGLTAGDWYILTATNAVTAVV